MYLEFKCGCKAEVDVLEPCTLRAMAEDMIEAVCGLLEVVNGEELTREEIERRILYANETLDKALK